MKFEQQACYQVSAQDNVATALGDIPAGSVSVTGDIGPQGKNIERPCKRYPMDTKSLCGI